MGRCDECGATFFGEYEEGQSAVDAHGTACPLCLLERMSSDSEATEDVESMVRTALAFQTTGEIRRRIVSLADDAEATERTGALRSDELRAVARTLDTGTFEDLTNRELRAVIAERADVEVTPASSFRKDELVEVLVSMLRAVNPDDG